MLMLLANVASLTLLMLGMTASSLMLLLLTTQDHQAAQPHTASPSNQFDFF
ncbi:MAG: hypothetical protein AAFO94_12805 [Bacteroidota bacterium]